MTGLAAPEYFGIHHKEQEYVARPNAGRHTLKRSITLLLALKMLGVAATAVEARKVVKAGLVSVNNQIIKEPKYPIGLNDVVSLNAEKKAYAVGINANAKITLEDAKASEERVLRVVDKYKARKNQIMVRLHDGSIAKAGKDVKVNDSVILDSKRAIKKVIPLKEGAECFIINGVHVGTAGKIKGLKKGTMHTAASAVVAPKSGEEFETIVKNIMVTG